MSYPAQIGWGINSKLINDAIKQVGRASQVTPTKGIIDPQTKITISGTQTTLRTEGDSITAGFQASDAAHRWTNIVATTKSLALSNLGANGTGIWVKNFGATAVANSNITTLMIGLNELIREPTVSQKTVNKILMGHRVYLNHLLWTNAAALAGASGSVNIVRTGTFTGYDALSKGGVFASGALPGSVGSVSSTPGDTWSYTTTCTGFVVQLIGSDGVTESLGTCNIYIDDVLQKTVNLNNWTNGVSDGSNSNQYCPVGYAFTGLTNASHTIKVTVVSGKVPLDYISTVQPFASTSPILIAEIPFTTSATYPLSAVVSINSQIKSLVSEYINMGMNVAFVKTNSYYSYQTNNADGIHPNDAGYAQIANAFLAAIP